MILPVGGTQKKGGGEGGLCLPVIISPVFAICESRGGLGGAEGAQFCAFDRVD